MTTTIRDQRQLLGLSIKALAAEAGADYDDVYAAERRETDPPKRNRAKHDQLVSLLRRRLEELTKDGEREALSRRFRRSVDDDADLEDLRKQASEQLEDLCARAPKSWDRRTEWRGYKTGDPIHISREEGTFIFLAFTTTSTGVEWVDCWGGRSGFAKFRCFRKHRVDGTSEESIEIDDISPTTVVG